MKDEETAKASSPESGSTNQEEDKPSIWQDPAIPVGDGPTLPRWHVGAFAVAWAAWVVFLIAILTLSGTSSSP